MPLLRPVSEKLTTSPVISWAKSWVATSLSSRFTKDHSNAGHSSKDGLHPVGDGQSRHWKRLSGEIGEIRVDHQLYQHSFEMNSVP